LEGREDEARAQKRRTYYVSNILIIDDPGNPENNGKVFLFRYGPQIFDKLNAVMFPSEAEKKAGVQSQNPFDLFSGRNIILKVKKQGTYNQYSDSVVMANNSPVADNDDKIMAIYNKCMPLAEFTAPSNFSSYEDLQKRVMKVFGLTEWFDTNALPASKPSAPKANSASTQEAELDEQIAESGADEEFNVDAILAQIKDKSSDNVPF
jgi:hypothetical protein